MGFEPSPSGLGRRLARGPPGLDGIWAGAIKLIVLFSCMYGLKPVRFRQEEGTSGAKQAAEKGRIGSESRSLSG